MRGLPLFFIAPIMKYPSFTISVVPGPTEELKLDGQSVEDICYVTNPNVIMRKSYGVLHHYDFIHLFITNGIKFLILFVHPKPCLAAFFIVIFSNNGSVRTLVCVNRRICQKQESVDELQ